MYNNSLQKIKTEKQAYAFTCKQKSLSRHLEVFYFGNLRLQL